MRIHKTILTLVLTITVLLSSISMQAQQFADYFMDQTLRLDYIFAGNKSQQHVYLSDLVKLDRWDGRKDKLSQTPIQGNGQVKIYDLATNKLIYVLPFSSLFQEWLTQDDAEKNTKSFENSYLIPLPKSKAKVQVSFFNAQREETILLTHEVDPSDILIRKASKNDTPYEVIHKASVATPIKVAIVAEGYQETEMDEFMKYANKTVQSLFQHEIFKKYEHAFEIVAVKSASKDSGISVPSKNSWKSTAVLSNFDTFYAERYLTTSHTKLLHSLLENIPYQHIIILANTDVYGGGGILNSYALTTTKNEQFAPVVVHEFGHSFAGLADEYFYAVDVFENKSVEKVEPWEKNNTSLVDFKSKWADLVSKNTPVPTPDSMLDKVRIGAFEGLKGNGLYIPSHDCRMKANTPKDFCPVCNRALEEMILFYTEK